jgi:hypothetical protein
VRLPGDRGGSGPGGFGGSIDGPQRAPAAPNGASPLGLRIDPGLVVPVAAWSLTTALGVILFALFLRRPSRREPALVGADQAGASMAVWSAVATMPPPLGPPVAAPGAVGGFGQGGGDEAIDPAEANIPRWLRPTLREQRQSDRGYVQVAREPARFGSPARAGVERRTIGYRLVRMTDAPDDVRSREVGRVDRGDQVEVIGEHEGFLQIRTPDGLEGWVPRVVIVG